MLYASVLGVLHSWPLHVQSNVADLELRLRERDGHLSAALEQLVQIKSQLAAREAALARAGVYYISYIMYLYFISVYQSVCACACRG